MPMKPTARQPISPEDGQEQHCWKPLEVIIPATLSMKAVLNYIDTQIRINATDAGDFVQQIRVGIGQPYSEGWLIWTASYLPGPPAPFPARPTLSNGSARPQKPELIFRME